MIDFYPIEDRNELRTTKPIFSLKADHSGTPCYALCERFGDETGLFIDPYGETRLMRPHLQILCEFMKSGEYGEWGEVIKVLEQRIEAGDRGLFAIGD